MSAQLEIRLVDASPQEQAIFDKPMDQNAPEARPANVPDVGTPPGRQAVNDQASPAGAKGTNREAAKESTEVFSAIRKDMTDLLGRYLPEAISKPILSVFDRLSSTFNRIVPRAARTAARRGFSKAGRAIARTAVKTRIGKRLLSSAANGWSKFAATGVGKRVASSATGRAVGGLLARGAAGAAASGTAAAGASAAGGAAGATAAGGALATVAAVAAPVAVAVAAIGTLAVATKALGDTFTGEAAKLRDFSAPLSAVQARREVTTDINLMDRAKRIGPELAQFESAKARLGDAGERFYTQVLELLAKGVPLLEAILNAGTLGVETLSLINASAQVFVAAGTPFNKEDDRLAAGEYIQALVKVLNARKELFGEGGDDRDTLQEEYDAFMNIALDQPVKRRARNQP